VRRSGLRQAGARADSGQALRPSGWLARSADQAAGGVKEMAGMTLPPWMGPALEWVAPLLWVFWGVGMVALLVVAAGSQFVIGRMQSAPSR
jgi:hypothetical protein